MANCIYEENAKLQGLTILNRDGFFKEIPKRNDMLGRWLQFKDTVVGMSFNKQASSAIDIFHKYSKEDIEKIAQKLRDIGRKVYNEEIMSRSKGTKPTTKIMDYQGTDPDMFTSEVRSHIQYLEDMFMSKGYSFSKVLMTVSNEQALIDVYTNVGNSLKYAFLLDETVDPLKLKDYIRGLGKQAGIKESQLNNFVDDMMGKPLGMGVLWKLNGAFKQAYTAMKYTPLFALEGGSILLLNNMVMGTALMASKRRGLEGLMKSDVIDRLMGDITESGYNILRSENRLQDVGKVYYDTNGKGMYSDLVEKVTKKIPFIGDKARDILNAVFTSGIHTLYDVGADMTVRRLSLAQALAKNGITGAADAELLLLKMDNGGLPPEFINKLTADAHLFYKDFFTSSNISSLNRHRFSRRWFVNTLQGYVIGRTAELNFGLRKFSKDFKAGKFNTRGGFVDYINTENQEIKALLNNVLLASKMSIYANYIANDKQDGTNDVMRYVAGFSDYLSSIQSTFFYRILTGPLNGAHQYLDYTAMTGKEEEFIDGVSVAALKTLSEASTMLFREYRVLDSLVDAAASYLKTGNLDFTKDVVATDLDKIMGGMGRFMLLPGHDAYGQKNIAEDDDMLGRILMNYDTTNESVREAMNIRDVGTVESMLTNKSNFVLRLFQYLPIIKGFAEMGNSKLGYTEAKYKQLVKAVDSDDVLQRLWNGEFPNEVLLNDDIADSLYKQLISHEYSYKKYIGNGEHDVGTYGLNTTEEQVFVDNIAKEVFGSNEAMDKALVGKTANNKALIKTMAAAESMKPGSSRIVLSYLANKMYGGLKEELFGSKYTKSADIDEATENEMKRMIVQNLYPYMYVADKSSRYKVAQEWLAYSNPDIFKGIENDGTLSQYVNSLGFLDMVAYGEASKGNVDAGYIKNVFNMAAKYIENPEVRMGVVNNTLGTINRLQNASSSQKDIMRIGVLGANIDFYNKLKRDPTAQILYKDDMDRFENIVWGTIEDVNLRGIEGLESDMTPEAKNQYYGSKGKPYTQSPNYASNKKALDDLTDKFSKYYTPIESKRPQVTQRYPVQREYAPKRFRIYAKYYDDQYKAYSTDITQQNAREYPSDFLEGLKYSIKEKRRAGISKPKGTTIPKPKKKYASTGTNPELPGGTYDISSD